MKIFPIVLAAVPLAILTVPPRPAASAVPPPPRRHFIRLAFAGDRPGSYLPAVEIFYPGRFNGQPADPPAGTAGRGREVRPIPWEDSALRPCPPGEFLLRGRRLPLRSLLP
jgi:hypothetical protein